jgi:DNA invertase Pin-like site-specific DNA recombinase
MQKNELTKEELIWTKYKRKSNEAKERQEFSIPDQDKEIVEDASRQLIQIKYSFEDEKTAFKPRKRVGFDQMIKLIKEGKINAIIVWKENRLCRNPEEGGLLLQLLQDGVIKAIRIVSTSTTYTPDSDHLILQFHFGMANQFSRNLSKDVKRGLYRKAAERKEYPRPACIGFESYGEIGKRQMRPHPIEAPFILKAFKLAATGVYSYGKISEELYKEGFRTKKGKKVSKGHIEIILKRPTYYGYFYHNAELMEGNYEPIITKGLFDLVQEKMADRSKPKVMKWQREFVKMMRCGTCGCAITTTIKKKFIKKKKEWKMFVYHHCTHRRGKCKEKPLTDKELKDLLINQLGQINIDKETWELGMKLVKAKYKDELKKNRNQADYITIQKNKIRDSIDRLVEMRTNQELTSEEFLEQKQKKLEKLANLGNKTQDNEVSLKTWLELMEEFLNTAFQLRDILEHGKPEEKQKILLRVGENFLIKDKNLTFRFKKPYDVLLKPELRTDVLPSSDVIISALEKIVKAFEDTIQVDLIRQRWEEIKVLQNAPLMLTAAI